MYIVLILFFISLLGISAMIGNKLVLLKNGQIKSGTERIPFEIPNLEEVRRFSAKKLRKYGYIALVIAIRIYVKVSIFLKQTHKNLKSRINYIIKKYFPRKNTEPKEKQVSKFLRMVSEYKHKIRDIKNKIEEEEKNY